MGRATRTSKAGSRVTRSLIAIAAVGVVLSYSVGAGAQTAPAPAENAAPTADNAVMLTIFFKHDQSRPLSELNAQLERQAFYKAFPPAGIEVVSWYVMMGIGQVVTLRLPASRGQSYPGEHRLGQLSHGILSDLRLQAHWPRLAREGADQIGGAPQPAWQIRFTQKARRLDRRALISFR
jgi:hypothetical protein